MQKYQIVFRYKDSEGMNVYGHANNMYDTMNLVRDIELQDEQNLIAEIIILKQDNSVVEYDEQLMEYNIEMMERYNRHVDELAQFTQEYVQEMQNNIEENYLYHIA
jgi:recombinational DNA repair ATPase RecF